MDKRIEYAFVEMNELEKKLKRKGIAYVRKINEDVMIDSLSCKPVPRWNQIFIERDGMDICSCVCHYGSYGSVLGLIECYDFNTEPHPNCTAQYAFEFIVACLERNGYGRER